MALTTITEDSTPVFCWFGGSDCWSCTDLIIWHGLLEKKYAKDLGPVAGLQKANEVFVQAWEKAPLINTAYDCRSFNPAFRTYAKGKGFLDALYSGIGGILAMPLGVGDDVLTSASHAVSNTAGIAETITKILKWLIPAALIAGAIGTGIWAWRKFISVKKA